jgi:Sec-independent protein translocase protein TatA
VFGLGMMEIGLIIVIAVMLFPPTELPKLVRSIAKIYGQVRRTAEDFRNTVLEDEDLRTPIDEIKGAYNDARWEVRDAERKARQQLAKAQMDMRLATARRLQAEREAEGKTEPEGKTEGAQGKTEAAPLAPTPAPAPAAPLTSLASAASAATAGPVRIAASNHPQNDDGDDDDEGAAAGSGSSVSAAAGPVAASDPRVISARRPPPPAPKVEPAQGDEPREGVA